jgi:hypothetical protein
MRQAFCSKLPLIIYWCTEWSFWGEMGKVINALQVGSLCIKLLLIVDMGHRGQNHEDGYFKTGPTIRYLLFEGTLRGNIRFQDYEAHKLNCQNNEGTSISQFFNYNFLKPMCSCFLWSNSWQSYCEPEPFITMLLND